MWRRPLAHAALRCADRALAASGGLAAALHIDLRSHVQHISFRFVSPRLFGLCARDARVLAAKTDEADSTPVFASDVDENELRDARITLSGGTS